ncbi:MAG: DUF721 domain-containing protein [Planctomycetota bacterium]|nr:DUF721 domain-containing protein [Planctomycetota bacterium]
MRESEQLLDSSRYRKKPDKPVVLGDTVRAIVENLVSPRQAIFAPVALLWNQLLPEELRKHSKISDISDGQMKVQVDSPSHAYELRLCSSELIKKLQQQCPHAKIKKIKFVVG